VEKIFGTILLLTGLSLSALGKERYQVQFELYQGKQRVDSGNIIITEKLKTWCNGQRSSYLELACPVNNAGEVGKILSTVDLFSGVTIDHRIINGDIELDVKLSTVQARIGEIRALGKDECQEMAPVVTKHSESYSISPNQSGHQAFDFGDNMKIRFTYSALRR